VSSESDFERLLREARASLPGPDAATTIEARERALAAIRPRRRGLRLALVVGGALVVALGLGVGLGALLTPSGSAAQGPVGLGFLPENGWNVVQSGAPATAEQPAYAVAANVPVDPEDIVTGGAPDPSGLPYATLLRLKPSGIVIVASFTKLSSEGYGLSGPPAQKLPLHISRATPFIPYGTQIRPEQPLGEYQVRAAVSGYDVQIDVYFGTSSPTARMLAAAQRQLDLLVVRAPSSADSMDQSQRPLSTPARGVIDRTLVCSTAVVGGARTIAVEGYNGTGRDGSSWRRPAVVALTSGLATFGGNNPTALDNSLAWVTAGRPSASATFVEGNVLSDLYRVRTWGTLALNRELCRSTKARVALGAAGLRRAALGPFDESFKCAVPRRVIVRVRAVLQSAAGLKTYRAFLRTTIPASESQLAVRSESGKPLAYAAVFASGRAQLFTASICASD
jgi:hypothetical protein